MKQCVAKKNARPNGYKSRFAPTDILVHIYTGLRLDVLYNRFLSGLKLNTIDRKAKGQL